MKKLESKGDYTVADSGEAFISQTELARLCGTDQGSISRLISTYHNRKIKQPLEGQCNKTQHTIIVNENNQLDIDSIELVIGHYAFESQRPTQQAMDSYRSMAKAGIKAYIYHEAGFELTADIEINKGIIK